MTISQLLAGQEQTHFTATETSQAFQEDSLPQTVKPLSYFVFKVANINHTIPHKTGFLTLKRTLLSMCLLLDSAGVCPRPAHPVCELTLFTGAVASGSIKRLSMEKQVHGSGLASLCTAGVVKDNN